VAVPDIRSLSAFDINKIQQSLSQYQATQNRPSGQSRFERRDFENAARQARAARQGAQRGGGYGIEDEYRYMVSQGFKPKSMQVAPQEAAPAEQQQAAEQQQQTTLPVNNFPEPKGPSMEDIASQFASQIEQMQQGFMQSMQQQQQMFQQMQTSQSERMEALQQQMMQAQVAQQQRPVVAGVKMAEGTGGTPMQIARRGVTGAFGRRGMRISSLNV
jgi:hypothetical protein